MGYAIAIYIGAITAANLLVASFGPWFSPINAFALIGLDLSLRDRLHDAWVGKNLWLRMFGLIAAAGAISYLLNPAAGRIAVASVLAFTLAALADAATYHLLRSRPWWQRANGSNIVGAGVDSAVFPTVAFGAFLPEIVALQWAAKTIGGAIWAALLGRIKR